jgi:hypothetical protein
MQNVDLSEKDMKIEGDLVAKRKRTSGRPEGHQRG